MPLNKNPQAAPAATPVGATPAPVAEVKPKRSLKDKVAPAAETAVALKAESDAATRPSLQPAHLDDKSKQIQKQGIWQAVVQSNALVQYAPTLEAFLELVDKAADHGLKYVNSDR